ncbi:MAG: hypothetical protein EA382_15005 [Spirochaetaceae bacterium]|nr:MAG: hypothetical protein EA382_15005 [Spirochaetaceae bacterium]
MMNTRRLTLVVVLLIVATLPVFAQDTTVDGTITIEEAIRAALSRSQLIDQAQLRVRLAELARDSIVDSTRPSFTLSADPAYGARTARGSNFASITDITDFPPQTVSSATHTTGLGVTVRQPLPTSGILTAAATTAASVTLSGSDDDRSASYSLSPSVSVSLVQPLFVDGRFVDTDRPRLALSAADAAVIAAELAVEANREQVVLAVVRLYNQLGVLRRAIDLQQTQQKLLTLQLSEAAVRVEQGEGSRQLLTSLEIQRNRSRDIELQNELAASEIKIELSRLTGLAFHAGTRIDGVGVPAALDGHADRGTPAILQARNAVDEARIELERSRKTDRATARIALSLTPRYQDSRESADRFVGAFTDYAGDGAGVDVAFSIGVDVPLDTARARARAVEQATIAVALAESQAARITDEEASSRAVLAARADTLRRRIELAEFDLTFETEQLASDTGLRDLGMVTDIDIARREATIASRRFDIDSMRSDLVLNALEVARLDGRPIADLFVGARSE